MGALDKLRDVSRKNRNLFVIHPACELDLHGKVLYLRALALLAGANETINTGEHKYLRSFCNFVGLPDTMLTEVEQFAKEPAEGELEEMVEFLSTNPIKKALLIDMVIASTFAGEFGEAEKEVINRLADMLSVSDTGRAALELEEVFFHSNKGELEYALRRAKLEELTYVVTNYEKQRASRVDDLLLLSECTGAECIVLGDWFTDLHDYSTADKYYAEAGGQGINDPKKYKTHLSNRQVICVEVEGGCFTFQGVQASVNTFYMAVTPITQKLYQRIMGNNPSTFNTGVDAPRRPVECVSWFDAINFCNGLSQDEGYDAVYTFEGEYVITDWNSNGYRLPTEAEWDYAARGGNQSEGYRYAGSNDLENVAWYKSNSEDSTQPVAQKDSNEIGLFDMNGNVQEWCWDYWDEGSIIGGTNPHGPDEKAYGIHRTAEEAAHAEGIWPNKTTRYYHIIRGGSFRSSEEYCSVAYREKYFSDQCITCVGFRVVRLKT